MPPRTEPTPRSLDVVVFEPDGTRFEISPETARVLLRIMRKAAERRGIDLDVTGPREADGP